MTDMTAGASTTPGTGPDTTTPGTGGGDQEMNNGQHEADTMPGTDACMTRLDNVPAGVLEQQESHKRKRRECPGRERRGTINCSEDQYYLNNEYYPTWRSIFDNLNVHN